MHLPIIVHLKIMSDEYTFENVPEHKFHYFCRLCMQMYYSLIGTYSFLFT